MASANEKIPVLVDIFEDRNGGLLTTDDLDKSAIPKQRTTFNTCTRSGEDRRCLDDRRKTVRAESPERRSGRDRRIFTYI